MNFADRLKAKGVTDFVFSNKAARGPQKKSLQDKLVEQIQNNITLLDDPTFKIAGRNNTKRAPEHFFKIDGSKSQVWISYSKKKLKINGADTIVTVPATQVKLTLEAALESAQAGEYNQELSSIAKTRSSAQKAVNTQKTK